MSFFDKSQPLGLPKGSVRSIIALIVVIATLVAVFVLDEPRYAALLGILGAVVVYYFEARKNGDV